MSEYEKNYVPPGVPIRDKQILRKLWRESYTASDFFALLAYKGIQITKEIRDWAKSQDHRIFH